MKNTNVITPSQTKDHIIDGYHFRVMSEFAATQEKPTQSENLAATENADENLAENLQENEPEKAEANVANSAIVEDLLKKQEETINSVVRLQMQLESQKNEFDERLNTELEAAKEKFTKEGYDKAKAEFDKEQNELKERFQKSIAKLDESSQNLDAFITKNEKELSHTAIDIAKEVINKEIEENSAQIALNLAKDLIAELKGVASIEIKVSPSDYEFVKNSLKNNSLLKISLDDAISKGSVVVLSDKGNIESNLNDRLTKIKKMVSE